VDSCPNFNIFTQPSQSSCNVMDDEPTNISAAIDRDPAEQSVAVDMHINDSDEKIILYSSVDEGVYVSPIKISKPIAHLDDYSDLQPTLKSEIKSIKEVEGENKNLKVASYKGKEVPEKVEELLGRGKRIRNASWHLKSPYKGTSKGMNWSLKYIRRCCWHYRKTIKSSEDNFEAYLKDNKRIGRLPK